MIKKVNKNLVKVTSTILVSAMFLTGCGAGGNTVAKVNGDKISGEEFSENFDLIKQNYEAQYGPEFLEQELPEGGTVEDGLKEQVLDKLIIEEIIMQKGEEEELIATDEEVNEEVKGFKEMVGGQEGFDEFLEGNDMDEDDFKTGIKKDLTVEKYRDEFLEGLEIEEKDLKEHYEANKDKFDTVEASHILVEKEEEAQEILKELEDGAEFGKLAEKSIEPDAAEREGDLGYFVRGQLVPEFEEAAFKLKVDEVSAPVKTEHGYHIIKVTDKKDTFDKVKEEVKEDLEMKKFGENLENLKEEAKTKTYMKNVDKAVTESKEEAKDEEPAQEQQPVQEEQQEPEAKDGEVKEEPEDANDAETQDEEAPKEDEEK